MSKEDSIVAGTDDGAVADTGETSVATEGLASNVDEIDEDEEQAVFDQMVADRAAGASLGKATGLTPKPDADGEGLAADPEQTAADAAAKDVADAAAKAAADAKAAEEGKAAAEKLAAEKAAAEKAAAEKLAAETPAEEDFVAAFMKECGALDISPDDATPEERSDIAKFVKDFPSLHKAQVAMAKFVDARNAARLAKLDPIVEAYHRDRLLDAIEAQGVTNARALANDPGFLTWLEAQAADVKALGQTGDPENNAKLLKAFATSKGKSGRTAEERKAALAVAGAGGAGARRPTNLSAPVVSMSGQSEISEEEAEAEFERLAAERAAAKTKKA